MHRPFITWIISAFFLAGCHSNTSAKNENKEEKAFFPVADFLHSQLKYIDSLQLPVSAIYTTKGIADTTLLSTADCQKLAAPFLQQDINDTALKSRYLEKSFVDQSIPSINFTYETKDSLLPLKRVDVVLKPDPVKADKVKSVYMEKLYQKGDSLIYEKLFWKADHYYQLIRSAAAGNSQPELSQLKVVWDATE